MNNAIPPKIPSSSITSQIEVTNDLKVYGNINPIFGTYSFNSTKAGIALLVNGIVTIDIELTSNSCIILQRRNNASAGPLGFLIYRVDPDLTAFSVTSYKADGSIETDDNSVFDYYVVEKELII